MLLPTPRGQAPALLTEPLAPALAEWPCPQRLCPGLSLLALGQTPGPGRGLACTTHPALSWESGMGGPRSLSFSLDSEAATGGSSGSMDTPSPQLYVHLPYLPCLASSPLSSPLLTTLPLGLRFLDCPPWLSPPGCPAFPISAAPRQPFLPHHPSPSAACAIS